MQPVSVSDENDAEILVVEAKFSKYKVRLINAYGPQEEEAGEDKDKIKMFYNQLDLDVKEALFSDAMVCLQLDSNAKLGPDVIPGDPKLRTKNGEKLLEVVEQNGLIIVNGLDICSGSITRSRITVKSKEESIIDFFIVCPKLLKFITKINIDEEKVDTLTKCATRNGRVCEIKRSDHNMLRIELEIKWDSSIKEKKGRREIYNYSNKESFRGFVEETENNALLDSCFTKDDFDLEEETCHWISVLNSIIVKSFKRVRINNKTRTHEEEELGKLFDQKDKLLDLLCDAQETNDEDEVEQINNKLELILSDISEVCASENQKIMEKALTFHSDSLDGFNQNRMWNVKKKVFPKNVEEPPAAIKDTNGNLITEKERIKDIFRNNYKERLKPNTMEEELKDLESLKEELFNLRMMNSKKRLSDDWCFVVCL